MRRLHLKDKIMQKFKLELLFHIVGIGSASGLLFNGGSLFIISDNSNVLYEYNIKQKKLDKIPLLTTDASTPEENIPKKDKPDFEAITASGDDLFLFGSGSKENRNSIVRINSTTWQASPPTDATDLYLIMQGFGEISPEDFNIEAAVNDGTLWYLFQRGNGPAEKKRNFYTGWRY